MMSTDPRRKYCNPEVELLPRKKSRELQFQKLQKNGSGKRE
jgi:hypothetical protein